MMEKWKLFIHGRFVCASSAKTIPVLNKASGETVATVPESSPQDVDDAIASASASFSRWRQMPVHERATILHRTATAVRGQKERLAQLLMTEVGKPLADARSEVTAVAATLDFFAEEGKRIRGEIPQLNGRDEQVMILKEPVGVVVAILPPNFPLALLSWKLGAALAAGCTLVAKPAEETPLATLTLAAIMAEAGLPAGVFNVVTGYGSTVGAALVAHSVPRKVAFTGGVETGKKISALAAQTNKRVTLEMGGQCPAIVCNDADLETAVPAIVRHSFRNAGQYCYRVNRIYAQSHIYDEFVERMMGEIKGLKVGPGTNPDVFMGPLINSRLLDRSLTHIQDAVEHGAQLVTGGERLSGSAFDGGYFLAPTLLTDTDHTMLVMTEETFGPVLGVMRMKSPEEAIEYANDTRYGLAAFVFTRDLARAMRLSQRLEAGGVWINKIRRTYNEVPFGGCKESGLGREKSHYGLEEYLELKAIYVSY